ncbi:putative death-receptor fusion protein-domain-containing protein [Biscogniauxia sp. FL1348]|nr:putative death-receptor fusion protein-domain-containing protein [Biscogniauxia sp. FL1348]
METQEPPRIGDPLFNPKHALSWIEHQPERNQPLLAKDLFQSLLNNAARPKQASGNACAKLCGFVEQCSRSRTAPLRSFAFAETTASSLFNFFLEWNEQDTHRSMRLVLDFLAFSISRNPAQAVGASIKARILRESVSIITQQASRPSTKSAMVSLDHLVQKKVFYLCDIVEIYQDLHAISSDQQTTWDAIIGRVFAWMEIQYVCPVAGKFLVTIFTSPWYKDDDKSRHYPDAWHRFIYNALNANPELLETIKHYIFVPLFKTDRHGSLRYLQDLSRIQKLTGKDSRGWDLNAMLWLAMLEAGKKIGVVGEPGQGLAEKTSTVMPLPVEVLEDVLCHESREARSSGVAILVACPSTTKPYTPEALELLKKHLPAFYEDSDAKFRYDVLGYSRNMIKRIQGALDSTRKEFDRALKKSTKTEPRREPQSLPRNAEVGLEKKHPTLDTVASELHDIIMQHEYFVQWYVGFLKGELIPTASYQRHITALRAMAFFLKSSPQASPTSISQELTDATWFHAVLDLIMDPFDDVREAAASLVMLLEPESTTSKRPTGIRGLSRDPMDELQEFCRNADELSRRTSRADHSDGVARSYELLCRWSPGFREATKIPSNVLSGLEAKLSVAEQDLALAVLQAPVHGDFASLRCIWGSLSGSQYSQDDLKILDGLQERAIACCQRVWETVKHVLCDDSPEGHLPEEMEEVDGLDTKDLLSYSFRAIHESSNLLRIISHNARSAREDGFLTPSRQNFEVLGRLTFNQLSNLRHRGAFTTVSQTFASCCQLVKHFPTQSKDDVSLLDEWYEGALHCIHTQASTTRRSAGIPAMVVGILSSKADCPSFQEVISKLQEIAWQPAFVSETDGSNLPQVHALNCLKDIFKTSFLSGMAERYLTDCLQLAANSLKSEIWAIRNCGLLLLRSLIDCLFGTNESKTSMEAGWDGRSIRIPYHKYKALPELLVNLLELGKETSGILLGSQTAESVFPALDIIRRAGPPEAFRERLYDVIAWYLGSHIWHVREIAARTLCSFLLKPEWLGPIETLVRESGTSANKLHGVLLTIKFLLERLFEVMPDQLSGHNIDALCTLLETLPASHSCMRTCTEAKAAYIDITTFLTQILLHRRREDTAQFSRDMYHLSEQATKVFSTDGSRENARAPLALLKTRMSEAKVQQLFSRLNTDMKNFLGLKLQAVLECDINIACSILEAMSGNDTALDQETGLKFVDIYLQVCLETEAPEPRTLALENLASLMDKILRGGPVEMSCNLPSDERLSEFWADLHKKSMNPSLGDAIVRVSGPVVATVISRAGGHITDSHVRWLHNWGAMMSEAGTADRTFDTRMAAVQAIASLSATVNLPGNDTDKDPHPAHLPWLLALYDALNDDDDEIREAAAAAAAPILGQTLVPIEAGNRLVGWLSARYTRDETFYAHVAYRMVGAPLSFPSSSSSYYPPPSPSTTSPPPPPPWTPAAAQLADALRPDDSLFVVEEQNLYVDEVREAKRWGAALVSLSSAHPPSSFPVIRNHLSAWILAGLRELTRLGDLDDGGARPLGWSSKPQVFAIGARVLVGASALVAGIGAEVEVEVEVREALRRFRDLGPGRVSGLLLGLCCC